MSAKERILDDVAKIAGGAVGVISNANHKIKNDLKERLEDAALQLDLVPREEFEKLESMLQKTRLEQDTMLKRIEALENKGKKK